MKRSFALLFASLLFSNGSGLWAQLANQPVLTSVPAPTPYAIIKQDGNSRIWERTTYEQSPSGQVIPKKHSYTELATGLNHLVGGQWTESKEEIDILPDGTAAATNGQHQVYFPSDIYNGQIELVTPNGQVMQSQPSALSYSDGNNTALIAVLTNSIGQLVSSNQVIYPNAFMGINADLRYTYTKAGFEQDVILHEQPPLPSSLGLNPETTKIEVLTEFLKAPAPKVSPRIFSSQSNQAVDDEDLNFGSMTMVPGKAFEFGNEMKRAQVGKAWIKMEGRQFLLEEVPTAGIEEELKTLPVLAARRSSGKLFDMVAKKRILPPQHLVKVTTPAKPIRLAKLERVKPGYVLDYVTVNSSQTNFIFQGDSTYYVNGAANFSGVTVFEGGAVIKYAQANSSAQTPQLNCANMLWQGSDYRPTIFTAVDDNSVGETISGSTGNPGNGANYANPVSLSPTNYYGWPAVEGSSAFTAAHFRMTYIGLGFICGNISITNAQFVNCRRGAIWYYYGGNSTNYFRNTLFANLYSGSDAYNGSTGPSYQALNYDVQNSTFFNMLYPVGDESYVVGYTNCNFYLTNCIFAECITLQHDSSLGWNVYGSDNGFYSNTLANFPDVGNNPIDSIAYPFETVGGGSYYLTNGSPFRNAGTTNIDSALLVNLATKTTYPPLVYSNLIFSSAVTLSPQAQRDVGAADLGYHYDPLDYVFGGCDLYTNLTLSAGTAIGWFENSGSANPSGQPYGLSLNTGANLTTLGTVTAPCSIVYYAAVQEGGSGIWAGRGWMGGVTFNGSAANPYPQLNNNFTKWYGIADTDVSFRDNWNNGKGIFNNCEFYIGSMGSYDLTFLNYTNCLFFRSFIYTFNYVQPVGTSCAIEDCTFYNGYVGLNRYAGQSQAMWVVQNTSFDGTGFSFTDNQSGNTNYTQFDYNAYNTNNPSWQTYPYPYPPNYGTLETAGAHDLKVPTYNWQSSWLGNYYLPTSSTLINAGSTTADQVGLYHFTTQTNQAIEANSIVDIGYHYIATGAYGNPLDSNGDGIPDYLEDANGDGIFDAGDLGEWQISPYGLGGGNSLQVFTPLK